MGVKSQEYSKLEKKEIKGERKQAQKGFERQRTKKERRDDDKSWMVALLVLVLVWLIMKSSCKYFVTKM